MESFVLKKFTAFRSLSISDNFHCCGSVHGKVKYCNRSEIVTSTDTHWKVLSMGSSTIIVIRNAYFYVTVHCDCSTVCRVGKIALYKFHFLHLQFMFMLRLSQLKRSFYGFEYNSTFKSDCLYLHLSNISILGINNGLSEIDEVVVK